MSARRSVRRAVAMLAPTLLWCAGASASPQTAASLQTYLRPSAVPAPADNAPNAARIELGKALFFDPRLSGSNWISCATCHNPALGWSDALPAGIGHNGKQLGRATPTILNTAYLPVLMWDGRKASLEDQALGPVESADEMHQDPNVLVGKLAPAGMSLRTPQAGRRRAGKIAHVDPRCSVRRTTGRRRGAGDITAQWRAD